MSFNITNEKDYLEKKAHDDLIAKERPAEIRRRLKSMEQVLKKLKEEGNMIKYHQLLRWCLC